MYNHKMKIIQLEKIDSTHRYLKDYNVENGFINPTAVYTTYQTNGIGSRGISWAGKKGN